MTHATSVPHARPAADRDRALVLWFDQVGIADLPLVGGKNASLGEMIRQLTAKGVRVPNGFATTAFAYRSFIQESGLEAKLRDIFATLDVDNGESLRRCGQKARNLILHAEFPMNLQEEITRAYQALCSQYGADVDVAVRSSATAEDLPDASFAGQQETYLNVHGMAAVLEACKRCFASIFTDRAISYRQIKGFDHFEVALSVGVQKMVRSDMDSSGVIFTLDTETGFRDVVLVTAAYGLGENVVQGAVNPDEYVVFKPTLAQGKRPILSKRLGTKEIKMIYAPGSTKPTKNVPVALADRNRYAIGDDDIVQLARWAVIIEDHYSEVRGLPTPMDIEWAKDGQTGDLFIVQARPETVQSQRSGNVLQNYVITLPPEQRPPVVITGRSVGEKVGRGRARVILDVHRIDEFEAGEVLVTNRTDPDWEPIMKKASAIVTNQGGRTCHAAIIAREMGIPAIVGAGNATSAVETGQMLTVSCCEGDEGKVYAGEVPFEIKETRLDNLPRPKTQILMNVGNPEEAFSLASLPCDGVGLARLEFIIANHIQVHPMALIQYDKLEDKLVRKQVGELTHLHKTNRPQYYVEKLAQGVGTIAAAFYPKPVIVRMSDFKTNEYANLLGGRQFEPIEENPMIGWRGASRYYDPKFRAAFALECQALKRVRDDMGLTNVIPMIPFCRTPEEGMRVLEVMAENGLKRGENGLQIYVMCELPSNVIAGDAFSEVFDGFSIGSNDLTQLTLGLDRDSALVAHLFDERCTAVKRMVSMAIKTAKANGRKIGICGQAPSDYPEFAQFLVQEGIDSISLNPDSVLKTLLAIADIETDTAQ
ncbi:MAG: phosphoenolpyruvate synthase [Limnothrix sp. CACIAM 69d]|nr:MAG: phosphoenolpyruvate synthase [Limnothrix sp. CACIAM 69d]